MPFNHFAVMAYALSLIAFCALAATYRYYGFQVSFKYRWLPAAKRLAQKCRAKLRRKPKAEKPLAERITFSGFPLSQSAEYKFATWADDDFGRPKPTDAPAKPPKKRGKKK